MKQTTNHKSQITNQSELEMDMRTRQVWQDDQEIKLTRMEYEVLEYLVRRAGRVVTYQELWREVWRQETALADGERQVVRQLVKRLRAKLGDGWRASQLVVCVRGIGFRCMLNHITLVE